MWVESYGELRRCSFRALLSYSVYCLVPLEILEDQKALALKTITVHSIKVLFSQPEDLPSHSAFYVNLESTKNCQIKAGGEKCYFE